MKTNDIYKVLRLFTRYYEYLQDVDQPNATDLVQSMSNPKYEDSSSFPLHCITFLHYITNVTLHSYITLHFLMLHYICHVILHF